MVAGAQAQGADERGHLRKDGRDAQIFKVARHRQVAAVAVDAGMDVAMERGVVVADILPILTP
jgi:hypothetical protein